MAEFKNKRISPPNPPLTLRGGQEPYTHFLYNQPTYKGRRKELRNNATQAERLLWMHLKNSNLGGLKFIRQYSAGPYILDFFCPKIRLAIELDGRQHGEDEGVLYDCDRNDYLLNIDIDTLRFWNNEIMQNINSVVDRIYRKAQELEKPHLKVRGGRG